LSLVSEIETRMKFGEFDCGCENREQIMGAGNWPVDVLVIGGAIVIFLGIWYLSK
jgi:hypothetical protein